jgi:hypothetical protein
VFVGVLVVYLCVLGSFFCCFLFSVLLSSTATTTYCYSFSSAHVFFSDSQRMHV